MAEHKAYDGRELRCGHLGLTGKATAIHAWDDWYYIMVDGTFANGNEVKGCYCRERADVIARYLKD